MKARFLRENGRFLPPNSFGMRKHYLADEEHGQLMKRVEKQTSQPNPVRMKTSWERKNNTYFQALDPSMMTDMLKGNMLNMIPMVFIGGWINWTFSGFVTTRVCSPVSLMSISNIFS
jgi:hypothetical protein